MPKDKLVIIALIVILTTAYLTLAFNTGFPKAAPKSEKDSAINQAKLLYRQDKENGRDFSNGPCLSDALMPGWVADIAHNPRQAIDDLAQNQCPAFVIGKAEHFVELDPDGNLIRAK